MIDWIGIETPELDKIKLPQWLEVTLYTPLQQFEIKTLIENDVWITARKEKMYVRNMETKHIVNCIRCLEGNGKSHIPEGYLGGKDKWLKIFNKELANRQ